MRTSTLTLLSLLIAGCGEQGGQTPGAKELAGEAGGTVYAEMLANAATSECRAKASAPNAGNEAQLQQVCDCTHDKIVAARPGPLEPEESRRAKLQDALNSCVMEIGISAAGPIGPID